MLKEQSALKHLQNEHGFLLELCARIRKGLDLNVESKRIRNYVDWCKKKFLKPHFELEEEIILSVLGKNVRSKKAFANHRRINRLLSCSCEDLKVLNLLEEELGTHIRFEEAVLYQEIKVVAGAEDLLENKREQESTFLDVMDWPDKFWLG